MILKVLGSGSKGNCYILETEKEALIIEAGVPFMEVKKALKFNVKKIVGVLVSHSHGDHAGYVKDYLGKFSVLRPYIDPLRSANYGDFQIKAFDLKHDVPCFGFHIEHPDMGKLLYVSDTEYVRYRFKNPDHILIEANYSMAQFEGEECNSEKREHVLRGHMSIEAAVGFIQANNSPTLKNVVLIHLSEANGDERAFRTAAQAVAKGTVTVAKKGVELDISKYPF